MIRGMTLDQVYFTKDSQTAQMGHLLYYDQFNAQVKFIPALWLKI
jgi:hypothetical protein